MNPRIKRWVDDRNFTTIGNLGEHVAMQVLVRDGYLILATQEDLRGGVGNIIEARTAANAEDFICRAPDGRLVTINSKATASPSGSGITRRGDLTTPRVPSQQRTSQYTAMRGELIDFPLPDSPFAEVIKVDLINNLAQHFSLSTEGRLARISNAVDVTADVIEILDRYPSHVPPPSSMDL